MSQTGTKFREITDEEFEAILQADKQAQEQQGIPVGEQEEPKVKTRPVTLTDMTRSLDDFIKFDQMGAFDSEIGAWDAIKQGAGMMVSDTGAWLASLPNRLASNFKSTEFTGRSKRFKQDPKAILEAKSKAKKERAEIGATQLQLYGNIGLNYEILKEGASLLIDKGMHRLFDNGPFEGMRSVEAKDIVSRYRFWKSLADIEKRRETIYAELATNDFLMMGADPEIREMIVNQEVQPDRKTAMGGSMWADPINYIPLGAGFRIATNGGKTVFRGAERAMLNEAKEAIILKAGLEQLDKVKPSPKLTETMKFVDGYIAENLQNLNKIAKNRPIALQEFAEKLPQGHPLREQIKSALNGVPIEGKSSLLGWGVGQTAKVGGKVMENTGALAEFLSRIAPESAVNLAMKLDIPEKTAERLVRFGLAGGLGYGAYELTDDELIGSLTSAGFLMPQLVKTYGRDIAIMGRELAQPQTTLPYWKRLSMKGMEDLSSRTIDRSVWFPARSLMQNVAGAAEGKSLQRLMSAKGKLGSTKSGGLYDVANIIDKTKVGRYLELGGRATEATATGGTIGGVFGFVAGGGEQDEATYGGVGAGGVLGFTGGLASGYGRFRGATTSAEIIQARHGDWKYFTENLLPAGQKQMFYNLPKEHQIAYASASMSRPSTEFRFISKGKDEVGGSQYVEKDGTLVVEVNTDSQWSLQPLLHHEITHYMEQVGGKSVFNDILIGNTILDIAGDFTKRDANGKPIKRFDENGNVIGFEVSDAFNELKFRYFSKFDRYSDIYQQSLKNALANGANEANARDYAKRKTIQQIDRFEAMEGRDATDVTAREIVAEHGVDFLLNDPRRYRDLHEGWVGQSMRQLVESRLLNNVPLIKNLLAKLGATFRADGMLASDNNIFGNMQRLPQITELIRKYNRHMEGLSKEQMNKKFPLDQAESTVAEVNIKGSDFARNPELIEQLRAGTFLKIDDVTGEVIPQQSMTPSEIRNYNRKFSEAIKEETDKLLESDEGLPEGHIRSTTNDKGETRFEGRFISEKVLDAIEARGGWNKAQMETLRSINRALRYGKNTSGGTDWRFSYFKATRQGGGAYVNARVQHLIDIPYGIEITQQGNINIRVINMKMLERNIQKAFRWNQSEVKRLYGSDLIQAEKLFRDDLHTYHKNHAEGKRGMDGLDSDPALAEAKANFINSMFGQGNKAHLEANPWLKQSVESKKGPNPTYQSRRIERIGKAVQLSGKQHVDYNKISSNFMPQKRNVDLDALLAQNPQIRSTDPNYMPPSDSQARANMQEFLKTNGKPFFAEKVEGGYKPKVLFHRGKIGEKITDDDIAYKDSNLEKFKENLGDKSSWEFLRPTEVESKFLQDHFGMEAKDAIYTSENLGGRFSNNYKTKKGKIRKFLKDDSDPVNELPDDTIRVVTNISKVWDYKNVKDVERVLDEVAEKFTTTEMFTYGFVKETENGRAGFSKDSMRIGWMRELPYAQQAFGIDYNGKYISLAKQREGMVEFLNQFKLFDKYKIDKSKLLSDLQYFREVQDGILWVERMLSNVGQDIAIRKGLAQGFDKQGYKNKYSLSDGDWANESLIPIIESLGYEGMKNIDSDSGGDVPSKSVLIFDSKNIKLVHGKGFKNYGTFDPNNPDIRYMPKFKGASDDIPKIIEDIDIATNIFGKVNAFGHAFDRSWHINTLVKRVLMNAENDFLKRRLRNAEERKDAYSIERGRGALDKADQYFYYMKYPLQDLVASLPDIKSQDIKKGLNSARNADPFEPIRDNFQGGTKRPLQDILQEMANVHEKIYPDERSTLNEIRGIGEILKDDYGVEIKESFLDDLYRRYRNLTKEEHEQFKAEEQKTLNELFNPEFNDIQDLGGGTKFIKPIDPDKNLMPPVPESKRTSEEFIRRAKIKSSALDQMIDAISIDRNIDPKNLPLSELLSEAQYVLDTFSEGDHVNKSKGEANKIRNLIKNFGGTTDGNFGLPAFPNLMPSAERKPVTFSARPEEIVTLDSENIKNFMPAHKNVRLEDYLDYPIFCLPSDRMGVGTMFVGPDGQKIPVDSQGQGGRGFMYLYEDGGWAFSKINPAKSFMTRVREIAGGRDHALVGITIMSDINHLNSVFGQLSLAQAYEAVIRSGHVSKEQMRDHLQFAMAKVANQKYGADAYNKSKTKLLGKKGEYKLPEDIRKALLSIDSPDSYKQVILDRKINFDISPQIVDKFTQVGSKIKPDDQKKFNIDVESVARDVADPELVGQPVGQVVALLKVPVNQEPKKVDFHLSYPWQVKGEAIGFLDQFKALKDLTSDKRVYYPDGSIRYGQPLQAVLPAFDKINPSLYMPNFKPRLHGRKDNIRADVLGGIKQDKFSPQQFKAKLGEVKGAKEMAEDIGLLDYLEGKKSVTKDDIDLFITENEDTILLRMKNGQNKYEDAQMEGGMYGEYTETLFELPKSSKYPFPDNSGGHWDNDRILMHMRTTKRLLDDGSTDGEYPQSLHIEEMQSDWHQYGRSEGYTDPKEIKEVYEAEQTIKGLQKKRREIQQKAYAELQPSVEELIHKYKDDIEYMGKAIEANSEGSYEVKPIINASKFKDYENLNELDMRLNGLHSTALGISNRMYKKINDVPNGPEKIAKTDQHERYKSILFKLDDVLDDFDYLRNDIDRKVFGKTRSVDSEISNTREIIDKYEMNVSMGGFGQSPAPFKNSWQSRAFATAIIDATDQGHSYLTWTTGNRAAELARIDRHFDSVRVRFTQDKFLKEDATNVYAVNAVSKDGRTIRKSTDEGGLKEIIGKDYAKEAIDRLNKEMKEVEMTDIKVPHKGRRLLYDKIIPDIAKRMAKVLGTRPPTKAKMILQENAIVPKYGDKAGNKTQEVWVMELPKTKEKLLDLPLYMPSLMPQQNIPQANTNIMNKLQSSYFTMPKVRIRSSRASQARDLEPENSYFNN